MGRKHKFEVEYQLVGGDECTSVCIDAADEACALGLTLDMLEDDHDGDPPPLAYVNIRRILPLAAIKAVEQAYQRGLQG